MNENVGASFGLSVLVVIFFAVVLYQPETPAPPVASVPSIEPVEALPPEAPPSIAARPAARTEPEPVKPVEPRGAFTRVREGETLTDVARRVYGSDADVKTLWLANRDRLDRLDSPVTAGSILRTP